MVRYFGSLVISCFVISASISHAIASDSEISEDLALEQLAALKDSMAFRSFRCEFTLRFGHASSVEESRINGPTENIRTVHYRWNRDGERELIEPACQDQIDNRTDSYDSRMPFQDFAYITNGSYTFAFHEGITAGTISPASDLQYIAEAYERSNEQFVNIVTMLSTDFEQFAQRMKIWFDDQNSANQKSERSFIEDGQNIIMRQAWQTDGSPMSRELAFNRKTLFPLTRMSVSPHIAMNWFVTDVSTFRDGKVFPKRLIYTLLLPEQENHDHHEPLRVYEYTVHRFEPDVIMTDADFTLQLPEGVKISDGDVNSLHINRSYLEALGREGSICVSDLPEILNIIKTDPLSKLTDLPKKSGGEYYRVAFTIIGVLLILGSIFMKWRSRTHE
jgi:hypothetical protein